jgi:O-antigen/teichoic acid export membrane protein
VSLAPRDTLFGKSARYFVASGAPALINFAALAVYTRLLSPSEFGRAAVVLASVALANAMLFQWLRSALRRFVRASDQDAKSVLGTVRWLFLATVGVACVAVAGFVFTRGHVGIEASLVLLGLCILTFQAWYELSLEIVLADLQPWRYGAFGLVKAVTSFVCGVSLVRAGFGAEGLLSGVALGYGVPGLAQLLVYWRGAGKPAAWRTTARALMVYGLPLTATFSMQFVIDSSDRLLLSVLRSQAEVGPYAAAYDLSWQALTVLMMVVNLAAFPLAVRALEQHGWEAAKLQLRHHAVLLMALALPATVGMALLARNIGLVFFGAAFREDAARLIPVLAAGLFLSGIKGYYFDAGLQLARKTTRLVVVALLASLANIALNLLLIPSLGALGAAWATLGAYLVAFVASVVATMQVVRLPLPWVQWGKVVVATASMALVLIPLREYDGPVALAIQVGAGCAAFLLVSGLLDLDGLRSRWLGTARAVQ